MDRQMQRLCSLKILSKNTTSHTSPVMFITRKITKDKRPVVDFRLLNTRIKRHNTATPLLRDIYQMLGKAQSTVLSCVDLKGVFHSLKLTNKAKDFCGILPYFGSPYYRYEVMPMGLSISPYKWIQYIRYVLEKMSHPENYIATMDDLLVYSREAEHTWTGFWTCSRPWLSMALSCPLRSVNSSGVNWYTWEIPSWQDLMGSLSPPSKQELKPSWTPQLLKQQRTARASVELSTM